jgi:26S proteasome regulatory subunit T6
MPWPLQVHQEGKYIVELDKDIDMNKCTPGVRVALKSDSYMLHRILPTKVGDVNSIGKLHRRALYR